MIPAQRLEAYALAFLVLGACGGGAAARGPDAGPVCAASGQSCAASQCCQDPSDSCYAQGDGTSLCAHAILPPNDGPACDGPASSTLDGVSIVFPDDRCSFAPAELAAGIQIEYTLVIAHDLDDILPAGGDSGQCARPDPTYGLILSDSIAGQGQSYCLCDVGRCAPRTSAVTSPRAGSYDLTYGWTGHNWSGPSDTNNPLGAAFPPGTYTFTVTATGQQMVTGDGAGGAGGAAGAQGSSFVVSATRYLTVQP